MTRKNNNQNTNRALLNIYNSRKKGNNLDRIFNLGRIFSCGAGKCPGNSKKSK